MPWSASSGATKNASTIATRSGPRRLQRWPEGGSWGRGYSETTYSKDAQHSKREDRVVQPEKGEVAAGSGRDTRAHAADDERDRERQEEERQDQLRVRLAAAIAASMVPTAQMPTFASSTPRPRRRRAARRRGRRRAAPRARSQRGRRRPPPTCRARSHSGQTARARAHRARRLPARAPTPAPGRAGR